MAAFYLIATLMVLQGLLFSYCETTTTIIILPSTVPAIPSLGGTETTVMGGGGGGTVTTVAGGGGISSSKTTVTTTSSVAPEKEPGPTVILKLIVTTTCSDGNLLDLNVSVQNDIKTVYTNEGFPIKSVIIQSISCSNSSTNITLELSFYSGISSGKTIKGVFQDALKGRNITNLTESNTIFTVTFTGETSTTIIIIPTTVQATPPLGGTETTAMTGDTAITTMSGGTVTMAVADTVTTAAGGGEGGTAVTTAVGGGGTATITTAIGGAGTAAVTTVMGGDVGGTVTTVAGGGGISSSKTTTTTTSSVAPDKEPGPTVILILIVTTTCCDDNLLALNVSVQNDIKTAYTNEGIPIKSVITQSISCSNSAINITLELPFYGGIPSGKTIKGVFQAALKGKKITNLTESNTIFTVTFTGVTLKYNPKAGQCQAICCGGGGALTVERECTPDDKCKGIEPDEKKEKGHCPKEEKGTCPDKCDEDDGSGGIHNSPSYALVTLLAIATFKMMFF